MTTPALADETVARTSPSTARPLLLGAMAALSAGAAAIHFAVRQILTLSGPAVQVMFRILLVLRLSSCVAS